MNAEAEAMSTRAASPPPLLVVDTNVLLAATDRDRQSHEAAMRLLREDERRMALCPQIIREYLAVATRPGDVNGLGLSADDAIANIGSFIDIMTTLPENAETTARLLDLISDTSTSGRQVHDANVAAVALAHNASALITDNPRHFARFTHLIEVEALTTR